MSQSNRPNASISALSFDADELEALTHDEETEREWQELLAWADVAEPERVVNRTSRAPAAADDGDGAGDEWALLLARAKAPAPVPPAPLTPTAPLEDEEWQWMVARAKANAA